MAVWLILVLCHVRVFTSSSVSFPVEDFPRYCQMCGSDFLSVELATPENCNNNFLAFVLLNNDHNFECFRMWFHLFRGSIRHAKTDIILFSNLNLESLYWWKYHKLFTRQADKYFKLGGCISTYRWNWDPPEIIFYCLLFCLERDICV